MFSALTNFWPWIAGAVVAVAGVVYGWFHKQKAVAAQAQADTAQAQAQTATDQRDAATAAATEAQAALTAVQTAQTERAATDAAVSTLKPGEAQQALINEGFTTK